MSAHLRRLNVRGDLARADNFHRNRQRRVLLGEILVRVSHTSVAKVATAIFEPIM
jgi:hypothetical protein